MTVPGGAEGAPLVSVVIPTLERGALLERALRSVLAQTVEGLEILVVGVEDTAGPPAPGSALADPRVRAMDLPRGAGASRAWNAGIRAARGRLVALLDDDDEWRPTKVEKQLARWRASATETPDGRPAGVVYCRYDILDHLTGRTTGDFGVVLEGHIFDALALGLGEGVPMSTVLIDRAALLAVGGFDERLPNRQDYDLLLRLADAGQRFVAVPESLATKHHHVRVHLSGHVDGRVLALAPIEERWGAPVRRRLGHAGYRRWRAVQRARIQFAYFMRVRNAVGAGRRAAAWGSCLAMVRYLPWSRRYFVQGVVLAALGPAGYRRLADLTDPVLLRSSRQAR